MDIKTFFIDAQNVGVRIDKFLSSVESLELTRAAIQNLIDKGEVSIE